MTALILLYLEQATSTALQHHEHFSYGINLVDVLLLQMSFRFNDIV